MLALGATSLLLLPASAASAYTHHASKVRFVEHSPEALETARRERKPVFLLVSAVWCYWCKYFEREALRDDGVSEYLNRHYLSIFVDHDRRADVARKYVRGLPMIVLFDPDGQVRQSFAGALKKDDFLAVLKQVDDDIRTDGARTPPAASPTRPLAALDPTPVTRHAYEELRRAIRTLLDDRLDTVHGGFGIGEKYPHPRLLGYLLQQYRAAGIRGSLTAVEKTLEGVLIGLYDPVDGGFFRYAETRDWRRPHYEKLVHLNASLALVFHDAYLVTKAPRYKDAAEASVRYLIRTLYDPKAGGFYGSQSADPVYYGLGPAERRSARQPPVNRDKVTAWNAEAALAFFALGESSGRRDLTDVALRTLEFMRRSVLTDRGVFHLYDDRMRRGQLRGQLDANAWAALAFLEGYRISRLDVYRQSAHQILGYATADLFDAARGVFLDAGESSASLAANGVMAEALSRAHRLIGRIDDGDMARRLLSTLGGSARALLDEGEDASTVARLADSVSYLRAYESVVAGSR